MNMCQTKKKALVEEEKKHNEGKETSLGSVSNN